jgi:hypothetical protein
MRSITATALSLWLGLLACLLGCATPMKAGQHRSPTPGVQCPERDDAGDSCCQHHPGTSEKNRHYAMSCCPTETALTQKQNLTVPALAVFVVVLLPLDLNVSVFDFVHSRSGDAIPWQTGRDILQQVHVLRI